MAMNPLDLLSGIGNLLDLPGSAVRDLLAGQNPLDQFYTPFSDENRSTGRDLLRAWGAIGPQDTWGNFAGGMAVEALLDPTNLIGGIGAGSRAATRTAAKRSNAVLDAANAERKAFNLALDKERLAGAMPRELLNESVRVYKPVWNIPNHKLHGGGSEFPMVVTGGPVDLPRNVPLVDQRPPQYLHEYDFKKMEDPWGRGAFDPDWGRDPHDGSFWGPPEEEWLRQARNAMSSPHPGHVYHGAAWHDFVEGNKTTPGGGFEVAGSGWFAPTGDDRFLERGAGPVESPARQIFGRWLEPADHYGGIKPTLPGAMQKLAPKEVVDNVMQDWIGHAWSETRRGLPAMDAVHGPSWPAVRRRIVEHIKGREVYDPEVSWDKWWKANTSSAAGMDRLKNVHQEGILLDHFEEEVGQAYREVTGSRRAPDLLYVYDILAHLGEPGKTDTAVDTIATLFDATLRDVATEVGSPAGNHYARYVGAREGYAVPTRKWAQQPKDLLPVDYEEHLKGMAFFDPAKNWEHDPFTKNWVGKNRGDYDLPTISEKQHQDYVDWLPRARKAILDNKPLSETNPPDWVANGNMHPNVIARMPGYERSKSFNFGGVESIGSGYSSLPKSMSVNDVPHRVLSQDPEAWRFYDRVASDFYKDPVPADEFADVPRIGPIVAAILGYNALARTR